MKTRSSRDIYENIDIILTYICPYIIGVANILSFILSICTIGINQVAYALAYFFYPSILFNLYLLNSSKRNKMCVCHRVLIWSNIFVTICTFTDDFFFKFSNIGINILSILVSLQIASVIYAGVLNWKYGIFERKTRNSGQGS